MWFSEADSAEVAEGHHAGAEQGDVEAPVGAEVAAAEACGKEHQQRNADGNVGRDGNPQQVFHLAGASAARRRSIDTPPMAVSAPWRWLSLPLPWLLRPRC